MKELALHTSRDRKKNDRIFVPWQAFNTPLEYAAEVSPVPLPIPPQIYIARQSRLKRLCSPGADSRRPQDLTEEPTAQTGFYTQRGLGEQASSIRPGVLTPDTPSPGRVLENMDGPLGSA